MKGSALGCSATAPDRHRPRTLRSRSKRLSPAQEILRKRLCDEAQVQEEAVGALAQALGQAGDIILLELEPYLQVK
jgi:hypothetical protein